MIITLFKNPNPKLADLLGLNFFLNQDTLKNEVVISPVQNLSI